MLDKETYLQVQISNLYIRRHGITPQEFLRLDTECDILGFLKDGYEPFHLTGEQGVLREVEDYIALAPQEEQKTNLHST
ncbi:MAG: DUF3791 domain-containing protein [Clostridiales Family XIII bacterium]|jgi:hypothetical protein|nr:DUF3791 domain-containing protein [Clostridiales Family XIII bacterium]